MCLRVSSFPSLLVVCSSLGCSVGCRIELSWQWNVDKDRPTRNGCVETDKKFSFEHSQGTPRHCTYILCEPISCLPRRSHRTFYYFIGLRVGGMNSMVNILLNESKRAYDVANCWPQGKWPFSDNHHGSLGSQSNGPFIFFVRTKRELFHKRIYDTF